MRFIKIPFADSGDKSFIPDNDMGGNVNMTQGYGQAYSLDPATDPSAKRIERDKMNGLFYIITKAIKELQVNGVAPFITIEDNGGSAFSYGKGAAVILNGVIYQSLVNSNTDTPPSNKWAVFLNSDNGSVLPVGVPAPWPSATPPDGWLKCNGATFSNLQYPKLALAYPSLKLPDLRGEFIRGWDDGRGVDSGRQVLSSQTDAMQPITGSFGYGANGMFTYVDGAFKGVNRDSGDGVVTVATSISQYKQAKLDSSTVTRTATETRPRNISFNFIVRAA